MNSNQISRFKEDFGHFMYEGYIAQDPHAHGWVSKSAWIIVNDF